MLRDVNLRRLQDEPFEVLVVGGGINGAVSAAALAGRGVRVGLVERGDYASQTSQASSNLAWGGFKYLEGGEIKLVWNLCRSRNDLMRAYPSNVREIRMMTLIERGFRWPPILLWIGTFIYWAFGRFFTEKPQWLGLERMREAEPGFDTTNGWGALLHSESQIVDNDARFVFSFVRSAIDHGAACANYVEAVGATRVDDGWAVTLRDMRSEATWTTRAKVIINAAGPWADPFNRTIERPTEFRHVLSKGVHLVVPQVTPHRRVLSMFTDDGRPFFALPMEDRTAIGTTDTVTEDPLEGVSEEDRQYLLDNANKRLSCDPPLTADDIIAERVGVRPLAMERSGEVGEVDWLKMSRRHVLEITDGGSHMTLFGGKLTDCLNVGDEIAEAVSKAGVKLPTPDARWYGEPGAEMRADFFAQARALGLPTGDDGQAIADRLWRRYGQHGFAMLERMRVDPSQREALIAQPPYLRVEIEHMARSESIVHLEDLLRRRTALALVRTREELAAEPGLWTICTLLFGERAEAEWAAYFGDLAPADRLRPTGSD